jgi:phage FluMu protein Com
MHVNVPCPTCKQHVLTVELRGDENREYSAQCPNCDQVNGFVIAQTQEQAAQDVLHALKTKS